MTEQKIETLCLQGGYHPEMDNPMCCRFTRAQRINMILENTWGRFLT